MVKRKNPMSADLFKEPSELPRETPQATNTLPKDWLDETVGALSDPLIVFPSGWEDTLPKALKNRLPIDRLVHNTMCAQGKAQWDEACDLEALLYLYPACLAHPFSEQWTRIYLYLGTKCLGDKLPQDIRHESLSDYDMGKLRELKRWIYRKKVEARKARGRQEKAEARVEAKPPPQLKMF